MGVVRERKIVCESAKVVPSNPESAANSGYTTQESEDEEQDPRPSHRQTRVAFKISNFNFNQTITRHTGKRKARRILNGRFLETLKEEEEDDVLIPNKKSNFQILMEVNEDAIECMNAYDQYCVNSSCLLFQENKCCYNNSYLNIPRKIRAAIGGRKNFRYDLLKTIETDLFNNETDYVHFPITCYERFLVHAVAKYYGLLSETIIINGKKAVKILGKQASNNQEKQLLCDYIKEIRKQNEAAL